ncbi:MAG: hypothetical protein HY072_08600, partial [Deltaproteobacteria bacterium]|nr:hypothetical protein [Deltaproteobacteria bacterium]
CSLAANNPGGGIQAADCNPGQVMLGINADGTLNCTNLSFLQSCPPGKVAIGITNTGALNCVKLTCPAGKVAQGLNASGAFNCVSVASLTNCAAGYVLQGFNATGGLICTPLGGGPPPPPPPSNCHDFSMVNGIKLGTAGFMLSGVQCIGGILSSGNIYTCQLPYGVAGQGYMYTAKVCKTNGKPITCNKSGPGFPGWCNNASACAITCLGGMVGMTFQCQTSYPVNILPASEFEICY